MGDAGWHDTFRVKDGQPEGLLLGKTEAMWLRACWLATGALKVRPTPGTDGGTSVGVQDTARRGAFRTRAPPRPSSRHQQRAR